MKPVLIIQNDPHEGAGQLATLLRKRGIEQRTVHGYDTDYRTLNADHFSGLVILGGAQSAYDVEGYPYLADEMRLSEAFMRAGQPIAGFCLGAQILAHTLGGIVEPGKQKEIGWYDLALTEAGASDDLLKDQPKSLLAYHFHGDVIKSVPGCENLARSKMTEWQLFRHKTNVYGFQYHAEVDEPLLVTMCENNASYLAANGLDAKSIIAESGARLPAFEKSCAQVLDRWIDLLQPQG
jgi:GMP synthase (glutamine-hydrolysing)